jgi:hypothetical protein
MEAPPKSNGERDILALVAAPGQPEAGDACWLQCLLTTGRWS